MAIIKCPECGHQISDKAPVCPSCGVVIAGNVIKCPYCGEVLQFGTPRHAYAVDCNKFIYNGTNCPYCKCKLPYKDIEKKWIWE